MTPTLISAFLTYTLITGPDTRAQQYPGAEQRHLPWSTPQPAGAGRDERRFIITMLICAALTFSLVELDSRFTLVLGWIGAAYILWLAWQIAKSKPATGTPSAEPVGFWASLGLQFVNVKIILYGIHRAFYLCSARYSRACLAYQRESAAGGDWRTGKSVLGAGGASVSTPVFAVRAATELDAGCIIGLLCCADRGGIKRERSGSRRVISRS
ncbi:LysE family transporter [Klebsiella pneumoniae subsp. ozaenae]|uniref:LysE family transporter n=1 Tax=Klebsiella pneumoniae subsp. ozaenae TaxID=574 RepID=A0A378C096_KLEPO|nr:LysE family transporter [Klebsiella pneumoniae subsp. ozaenae]